MQRLGDEFLARAAFAQHKNGGARRRDLLDNFKNLLHHRRLANDVFQTELGVKLLAQRDVFHFQILLLQARAIRISSSSICKRPFAM